MRTIYQIAKSELHSLFCSPIAWIILMIFTFQESMAFNGMVIEHIKGVYIGNRAPLRDLTRTVYISGFGTPLFSVSYNLLYFFIPLLTMGLLSREYSSGSIKLLFSSPITSSQIILGKYLSMLIYGLILIGILAVYVVIGFFIIKDIEVGLVINGLFAIYLLICVYSAIGLFISCLTHYQIVAAILSITVIMIMNNIAGMFQTIPFIRELTFWLGMGTHGIIGGLITSGDILYYILVSLMFILFAVLKLHFDRNIVHWIQKAFSYTGVLFIILAIGYITSRPQFNFYYDVTTNKQMTITQKSQDILSHFKEQDLKITAYVNTLDLHNASKMLPGSQLGLRSIFGGYIRFKPDIELDYIYYYGEDSHGHHHGDCCDLSELEDQAKKQAKADKMNFNKILSPDRISEIVDLSDEEGRVVRLIEASDGSKAFLRMYNDLNPHPSEQEISVALKTMIQGPVILGYLAGHDERSLENSGDKDFDGITNNKSSRGSLINQGFVPKTVVFNREDKIPEGLDVLVVADARDSFTEEEMDGFRDYIHKGGNMIIATDVNREESMGVLLKEFGVKQLPGILVQEHEDYPPTLVFSLYTQDGDSIGFSSRHPFLLSGAVALAPIEDKGFNIIPLIATAQTVWNELESMDFGEEKPKINPAIEQMGSYPVGLALTRNVNGKEQRIIILGDSDCISRGMLTAQRNFGVSNNSFVGNMFSWLVYNEYPTYFPRKQTTDDAYKITYDSRNILKTSLNWLFPGLWILIGTIVWIRRKSK